MAINQGGIVRGQPNRSYQSNDRIYTPDPLADRIVRALQPTGRILEPCEGGGAFRRALAGSGEIMTLDADHGDQFGFWNEPVDWVITNPPWSNFRAFLTHALEIADHVAFLATVNHWWTKSRVRLVTEAGFGYRDLWLMDWPPEWPASGFQLGIMHVERGYRGPLSIHALP